MNVIHSVIARWFNWFSWPKVHSLFPTDAAKINNNSIVAVITVIDVGCDSSTVGLRRV